jgi:NitT/TauT family transport system substrate-binding protein
MTHRLLPHLIVLFLFASFLGCSRDNPNANSHSSQLQKIKIASGGHSVHFLPLDLAAAKGFFQEEGFEPEITQLQGGTATAQALIAGQVDFSINGIDHALKAAVQGKNDLRMVALLNRLPGMSLVVDSRMRDKIKTIADLKGKSLGVTSKGSTSHMVLASLLSKNGVNPSDVTIVNVSGATFPAALENKQIVGGMALEPFASVLLEQNKAFALAGLNTLKDTENLFGGPYNIAGVVTRQEVIDNRSEQVQKVVNVLVRALKWIQSHSEEEVADALPIEVVGSDKRQFIKTLKTLKEFYSPDGIINPKGAKNVYDSMVASDSLPAEPSLDVTQFFTNQFVEKTGATQPAVDQTPKAKSATAGKKN